MSHVVQIIYRSTISPWEPDINYDDGARSNLNGSFLIHQLVSQRSRTTRTTCGQELGNCGERNSQPDSLDFESLCLRMKDLIRNENETSEASAEASSKQNSPKTSSRIISIPNPSFSLSDCAILSPSLIWKSAHNLFTLDDLELNERLQWIDNQGLLDVLYGIPRLHTGLNRLRFYSRPAVNAFATTVILNDFHINYVNDLRKRLLEAFPDSRFIAHERSTADIHADPSDAHERRVFVVHYRGPNYLLDYAPQIIIYFVVILYIVLSVKKIDSVKSKFGLAIGACVTVVASLFMSMSVCEVVGLISSSVRGREYFPYLVVLVGFENVNIFTESVVATPIDLPVKYRIAQGLAKEGWPITRRLLAQLGCIALGFLTFNPDIQEFCLIAVVGLTTQFFLQLFFFVPVLAVDIRRMELSDLCLDHEVAYVSGEVEAAIHGFPCGSTLTQVEQDASCLGTSVPSPTLRSLRGSDLNTGLGSTSTRRSSDVRRAKSPAPNLPHSREVFWKHRRTRSDAQSVCFLKRNSFPASEVPLLIHFKRYWARLRVFQRISLMLMAAWIIFLLYALVFRATPPPDADPSLNTPENSSLSTAPTAEPMGDDKGSVANAGLRVDIEAQPKRLTDGKSRPGNDDGEGAAGREALSATEKSLFKMTSTTRQGIVLSWHVDTLWRYMAFTNWPAIAALYNFSLTDHRLVIFEPIYLSARIPAEEAIKIRPSNHLMPPTRTTHRKEPEQEGGQQSRDTAEDEFDVSTIERAIGEQLWTQIASFGRKESLAALGKPLSGLLNWTSLWTTAEIALASLLGSCFFFTITCVGMLIVHRTVSWSEPHAFKEPVVRVLPLTIELTSMPKDNGSQPVSAEPDRLDWLFACGSSPNPAPSKTGHANSAAVPFASETSSTVLRCGTCPCTGDYYSGRTSIIAVTLCGQSSGESPKPSLSTTSTCRLDSWSRSIRVWSVDCGHLVAMIDRYSREAMDLRKCKLARRANKYAAVWSMKILPTGELIAGCSDGTLEIWDPIRKNLRQVLDLQSCTAVMQTCGSSPAVSSGQRAAHLGGITWIELTKENCFFVGSSAGYVGMVRLSCDRRQSGTTCRQPLFDLADINSAASTACISTAASSTSGTSRVTPCSPRWCVASVWAAHTRAVSQITSQPLLRISSSASTHSLNSDFHQHYLSHSLHSAFFVVSGSEDGSLTLIETHKLHFQRFSWDPSPVLCVDLCHFTISVGQASGRLHLLKTCFLPSLTEDRNSRSSTSSSFASNSESRETVFQVTHYDVDSSVSTASASSLSMKDSGGNPAPIVWVKLFPLTNYSQTSVGLPEPISPSGFHLSLSLLRLVTCSLDGTVSIWRLDSSTPLLQRFRTNSPTFALPAPVLAVDERVIIGDQGYLRLINPWSTQCERSIQLLPPSDQSSGVAGSYRHCSILSPTSLPCLRRWASGLGPVVLADGSSRSHCIVSLADAGRTLVVVPKSAFVN
ncbi:hypothetical protein SprV_0200790800 [Sparganum proliferum]